MLKRAITSILVINLFCVNFIRAGDGEKKLIIPSNEMMELKRMMLDREKEKKNFFSINKFQSFQIPQPQTGQKKSLKKALFKSLFIPGWGESSAEGWNSGKYFFTIETLLLGTMLGLVTYGNWLENSYKTFAASHAGVNVRGKDDVYFAFIGTHDNIYSYNADMLHNRDTLSLYSETEGFFWEWDSEDSRLRYRRMFLDNEDLNQRVEFALLGIFINHVASGVNAARIVRKFNKRLNQSGIDVKVHFRSNQSLSMSFQKRF